MKARPLLVSLSVASAVTLGACRVNEPTPVAAPRVGSIETQPSGVAKADEPRAGVRVDVLGEMRADSIARLAKSAPLTDEVAKTVIAVFGDSTALQRAPTVASDSVADRAPVWDIDVRSFETHERVTYYVQMFTTTARERFNERLSRGTRYEPMIRAKLRAGGMPEDLTYLALIESGYDPHAYSRAAAVGMWQFMSSTARDVGLRVDWWMDERRDPARSTDGAIRFLGDLQKQFGGSLYLAAAAYNGGPGRVARGLTRIAGELNGTEGDAQFFKLADHDYLRAETKNYVPQLIAAALIAKRPSRYGMALDSTPPFVYDSVRVDAGTSLAVVANAISENPTSIKELNPALLRGITPPDSATWIHVPLGTAAQLSSALDTIPPDTRRGFQLQRVANATTTMSSVASRAGITVKQLALFNPKVATTKKGRIASGEMLRVPRREVFAFAREVPDPSIERWGSGAALARGGYHVVRRGETLASIASRSGLTVARLKALNGIKGTRAIAGQTLRVTAPRAASTTKSSTMKSGATKSSAIKSTAIKSTSKKSVAAKKPAVKRPPAKKTPLNKPATTTSPKKP